MRWPEMQSFFVRVGEYGYFLFCLCAYICAKIDFRLVTNEILNSWRPSVGRLMFLTGSVCFPPTVDVNVKGLPTLCR